MLLVSADLPMIVKRFISIAAHKVSRASSVSYNRAYSQLCIQASREDDVFADCRRNPIYNEILEHVSEQRGEQYLDLIACDVENFVSQWIGSSRTTYLAVPKTIRMLP